LSLDAEFDAIDATLLDITIAGGNVKAAPVVAGITSVVITDNVSQESVDEAIVDCGCDGVGNGLGSGVAAGVAKSVDGGVGIDDRRGVG
jgi:hypothetical protein